MVHIMVIRSPGDVQKAVTSLSRVRRKLPSWNSGAMLEWGNTLVKDLKSSARMAGIKPFSGTLFGRGIEYRQRPNGKIGRLFIRQQIIYLDSMKPHYVNIMKRRTRLLAWAQQARSGKIKEAASEIGQGKQKLMSIYVRPHPFINAGWKRARPKLSKILNRHYKRGLQASIR